MIETRRRLFVSRVRSPRIVKDRADEFGFGIRKGKVPFESRSTDRILTRPARSCASAGQEAAAPVTEDLRERDLEAARRSKKR